MLPRDRGVYTHFRWDLDIQEYISTEMYGDLMVLFEFFMVYLEDGDNPGSAHKFVVAHDPKPAEFKCWLVADPTWNFD